MDVLFPFSLLYEVYYCVLWMCVKGDYDSRYWAVPLLAVSLLLDIVCTHTVHLRSLLGLIILIVHYFLIYAERTLVNIQPVVIARPPAYSAYSNSGPIPPSILFACTVYLSTTGFRVLAALVNTSPVACASPDTCV